VNRLVDIIGYLGILLHGGAIVSQSMALGGALFLIMLARPYAETLDPEIARRTAAIAAGSALVLVVIEALATYLQVALLSDTLDLPVANILQANFAVAGLIKAAAAAVLALLLLGKASALPLVAAGAAELVAATLTTHANARLNGGLVLLPVEFLHQVGAAIWIGGIPCFVMTLARLQDGPSAARALAFAGARFSQLSMIGVACVLVSGLIMSLYYIGSIPALYGTAYGVMVCAKIALFLMLLTLGAGNFLVTRRLRQGAPANVLRMRRFAEVEIGIGFTLFFAAASLTSVPPAIDLTQDRATWQEIVDRDLTLKWPRLISPGHAGLGIPALQAQLDREAAERMSEPRAAFVEGSGELPPRNADDIAWSEFNHHWAGIFVFAIGGLALLNQAGLRWARHWPLVFLGLAGFLLLRSDPEIWPLGDIGIIESLRDPEVVQHRLFALMPVLFGLFEWCVQTGRLGGRWRYVFPMVCATGGALLLTHNHTIANVKDALLIEFTHTPLALAAIVAGWARWLELRLDGRVAVVAAWVWPACFLFIGLLLLFYREA
jgi:putative copper resistance protein D